MLITQKICISPLLYGTWLLRTTNDMDIENGLNYVIIKNDNTVKLKTLKKNGLIGVKNSRTAYISDIVQEKNNTYLFKLNYSQKNTYSNSFLDIKIPEIKSNSLNYYKEKNLTIDLFDKILYIKDNTNQLFYIFDLYVGTIKNPNIETSINTFMFTQLFGILLNLIINKIIDKMNF